MIWKLQPFSTSKEIGREYNAHCALVPNPDDWILILDYDAMILTHNAYKAIEAAIARYPDTAIFGAMTNRIAYSYQRATEKPDMDPNIAVHIKKAELYAEKYADGECEDAPTVAGFFMLFRKSYWERSPFQDGIFDARGRLFDYNFTRPAMTEKLPIRVIKGAYLWHTYRIGKDYKNMDHLK